MKRICPVSGCEQQALRLLCPGHWRRVPNHLKAQVWRTWRSGRRSVQHLEACRAAIGAVERLQRTG